MPKTSDKAKALLETMLKRKTMTNKQLEWLDVAVVIIEFAELAEQYPNVSALELNETNDRVKAKIIFTLGIGIW